MSEHKVEDQEWTERPDGGITMNVSKMVKDRLVAETDAATRACIQAAEDAEDSPHDPTERGKQ